VAVEWLRVWESGEEYLEHRDGIPWHEAQIPRRWHKCVIQTRGLVTTDKMGPVHVTRCACGAVDIGDGWLDRNTRIK
jgi:hypothetical protein